MTKYHKGGQAPFGYRWESGKLVIAPHEISVRRYIYSLFLKYHRKKAVARHLNKEGFRTRHGAKFSAPTITRIITDPIGRGLWRTKHTQSVGKNKTWTTKPEEDWVYIPVPAIMSDQEWEECQKLIGVEQTKASPHLFRDRIVCYCGARMNVRTRRGKYLCPSCSNFIEKDKVEDIFAAQLKPFLTYDYQDKVKQNLKEEQQLLLHLSLEANKIQTVLFHDQPPNDNEELRERLVQIKETVALFKQKIQKYRQELSLLVEASDEPISLSDQWRGFTFLEKRHFVKQLLKHIKVDKTNLDIVFAISPLAFNEIGKRSPLPHREDRRKSL